LNYDEHGRPF